MSSTKRGAILHMEVTSQSLCSVLKGRHLQGPQLTHAKGTVVAPWFVNRPMEGSFCMVLLLLVLVVLIPTIQVCTLMCSKLALGLKRSGLAIGRQRLALSEPSFMV